EFKWTFDKSFDHLNDPNSDSDSFIWYTRKEINFAATSNLEHAIQQTEEKVAKIAAEYRGQNRKFRDREFDIYVNMNDCLYNSKKVKFTATNNVKRVTDIYKNPQFFINGVEPNDIRQGEVGDCWFVASLA
ncbi:16177_t:CDS:2, partial [Racocetra fulgida]